MRARPPTVVRRMTTRRPSRTYCPLKGWLQPRILGLLFFGYADLATALPLSPIWAWS